jgi:CBS domain-containing protein
MMKVQDVMTRNVEVVRPTTPITEAARRMRDLDVGALPVGEDDRLIGIVTDRDLVIRGLADGAQVERAQVRQCMTPQVLYCFADESVEDVAANMADNQVRRLPVVDRDKRLVGIVALADVASAAPAHETGSAVREISPPH